MSEDDELERERAERICGLVIYAGCVLVIAGIIGIIIMEGARECF